MKGSIAKRWSSGEKLLSKDWRHSSLQMIGKHAMYHRIEFARELLAELDIPGEGRIPRVQIEKGTRLRAQIRPYIVESALGPIEVADLLLEDDTVARTVPFASFRFLDE
jgi:hypothetical protein